MAPSRQYRAALINKGIKPKIARTVHSPAGNGINGRRAVVAKLQHSATDHLRTQDSVDVAPRIILGLQVLPNYATRRLFRMAQPSCRPRCLVSNWVSSRRCKLPTVPQNKGPECLGARGPHNLNSQWGGRISSAPAMSRPRSAAVLPVLRCAHHSSPHTTARAA